MAKPQNAKVVDLGNTATVDTQPYDDLQKEFIAYARTALGELKSEVAQRNTNISARDSYIYGDLLETSLDIPIGHDRTSVNWLRRTVEIHKIQFMGRPFQTISTYDTKDTSNIDDEKEKKRVDLENKQKKTFAEMRKNVIDDVIRDNGGHALFMDGAESASAIGDWIIKAWYDEENKKYVLSPIEAVENCYAIWEKDDFRDYSAFGYVYQVSKQVAMNDYGCGEDVQTSVLGQPLDFIGENTVSAAMAGQPMVTVMEITGSLTGWGSKNGQLKKVKPGNETDMNVLIVGNYVKRIIDDEKKLPKHYIFPNKKQRRRPWGASDVSDAAVQINATYVETLSDWRTVAAKVNFPKFRGYNFGPDITMPKFQPRKIQVLPLGEGQDLQLLPTGDANAQDFKAQMDELKEQFVRETGISRVLFDDPSITLNSNQALLTSMKPTSDIAEAKKQLWAPILIQMFRDAIETIGQYDDTVKELADTEDSWWLKLQWPSVMQKEDPVYQQMLLNRKNAGTISVQSYLEAQGETSEELDRIREEMNDPVTASIHGNSLGEMAHATINKWLGIPPWGYVVPKVNLRGDLTPNQEGNVASNFGFNDSPFPPSMGPQGYAGTQANDNQANQGFLQGQYPSQTPIQRGPTGAPVQSTPANNQPGTGAVSQPGSGATSTSPQGALDQANQNAGG
jgi:hypothetical protein